MADLSLSAGIRPKLTTTNSVTVGVLAPTSILNDTDDTFTQYFRLENLTPNPVTFTVSCTFTITSSTITSTAGFANVRIGDAVTGTGIPANTIVTAKASDSSITINTVTTAGGTGATLTFTPPVFDSNLAAVQVGFTQNQSVLTMAVRTYKANPLVVADTNEDGFDNSTILDYGNALNTYTLNIDIDDYLTNARVARSA